MGAEVSTVERVMAVLAVCLEDGPNPRADAWQLVTLIPGSELRGVVRMLAEEVALRTVSPAVDPAVALEELRVRLLEAVAARG